MSIPPESPWRGCAANFPQPVREQDEREARNLTFAVFYFNCYVARPTLSDIVYRSSDREDDVLSHVFRWDTRPYQEIFRDGFQTRPRGNIPEETYFNLSSFVNSGGSPINSTNPTTPSAFVSTTLNSDWRPLVSLGPDQSIQVYRYEIYAPGGICAAQTYGDLYLFPNQAEVCFVAGIARQYIRSAQLYTATRDGKSMYPRWERTDNEIIVNGRYNPQAHPSRFLNIRRPIFDYIPERGGRRAPLNIVIYNPQPRQLDTGRRKKRETKISNDEAISWYTEGVANTPSFINAAFRSSYKNEAYIFVKNEYVCVDYAPRSTNDKVLNGPLLICDGFPSLIGTPFGEHGIDCAFDTGYSKAFIFSEKLCAYIDFVPTNDKILSGPMTIRAMFPFFKDTVFENGIDSAFRSSNSGEAYLFKRGQYALINYHSKNLIHILKITEGFHSLRGTIFETGIDAAFASHQKNEAYIFKGDQYALINFAPGSTDDYIIGGPKPIDGNWPSLKGILSHPNRGLADHYHRNQA